MKLNNKRESDFGGYCDVTVRLTFDPLDIKCPKIIQYSVKQLVEMSKLGR